MARSLATALYDGGRVLLDMAYPPACPSCHVPVAAMHNFCPACFAALRLIAHPACACCGIPFALPLEGQCPACLAEPPPFGRLRAVMVYDAVSAPLISTLKFRDQWAGLSRFGGMMAACGRELLATADVIVPVPLNWRRLWWRKYNQAALLAYALAQVSGHACLPQGLVRIRRTRPQMRLARSERLRNVKGAFAVPAAMRSRIAGARVLLVDDVVTTGATVSACAEALLKAGAAQVDVLALARTVKE